MEKIYKYKGTYIHLEKIKSIYNLDEHKSAVELIKRLIKEDIISPVKASELTPVHEKIHTKYRIIRNDSEIYKEVIEELSYCYHPSIKIDYFRNNPAKYLEVKGYLQKLNDYLINKSNLLENKISINERSFEIFQEEKFLASRDGDSLFNKVGIDIVKDLNVYKTPEPFIYLSINRKPKQKILIIENKDTYITVSKLLLEGHKVLGEYISTIVYGEGNKVTGSFPNAIEDLTLDFLVDKENIFYYWGDIDKQGFIIYNSLKDKTKFGDVILFEKAYKEMIKKSKGYSLKPMGENQNGPYMDGLNEIKNGALRKEIDEIFLRNEFIPQEILNYYDLRGDLNGHK